ncbi:MAG TPA: type II secretion system protein [Verrucomicrobiae bacterium]|jgi:type II secretory pathway pseudopilin PulG
MLIQALHRKARHARAAAFTLVEALFAFTILALSIGGIVYGYSQLSRLAEFTSMSAAAQSYALQGLEQARSAQWNPWDFSTNTGVWSENQITVPSTIVQQDLLDIPMKGNPFATNSSGGFTNSLFYATNYIIVTQVTNYAGGNSFPANLRQIESVVYWTFPMETNKTQSNVVITLRASDE